MKFPYVRLEEKKLILENEEIEITNKVIFNRALNKALKDKKLNSFLVVGKEFNFRMRFLKSGTANNPRWTSEKKINSGNIKFYLAVGDTLSLADLLTFYSMYKVKIETEEIKIPKRGRPAMAPEDKKPRKKYKYYKPTGAKKGRPKSEETLAKERWRKWHEESGVPLPPPKRGRPRRKTLWYTCELPPEYQKS